MDEIGVFQGAHPMNMRYHLTLPGSAKRPHAEVHASNLGELINFMLTLMQHQDFCRVRTIYTSEYLGSPDQDDSLRCIGEGTYCLDGRGTLVHVIAELHEGSGLGSALNALYAQELAKLSTWNAWAMRCMPSQKQE